MALDEWVDVSAVKKISRHTSTFVLGLLISVMAKPGLWCAIWISGFFHQPFPEWLLHYFEVGDDVLIAYFGLALFVRLVIELWPFTQRSQMLVLAGLYGIGARHGQL